jgi:hypothetical protein
MKCYGPEGSSTCSVAWMDDLYALIKDSAPLGSDLLNLWPQDRVTALDVDNRWVDGVKYKVSNHRILGPGEDRAHCGGGCQDGQRF